MKGGMDSRNSVRSSRASHVVNMDDDESVISTIKTGI
jgi:hypothetical protein